MQFSTLLLTALATLATAQNPFSFTTLTTVTAGTPFNITWTPSTGTTDTVSLILRQGNANALNTIATIASGIQNTGYYVWTPSTTLVAGTGYAFEIVDDGNTNIDNYSNQFTLNSPNTVSSAMPSTTGSSMSSSGMTSSTTVTSEKQTGTSTSTGSMTTSMSGSSTVTSEKQTGTSSGTVNTSTATKGAVNAARTQEARVGAGLLAVVGAVMAAL